MSRSVFIPLALLVLVLWALPLLAGLPPAREAEIRAAVETYVLQKTAGLGYEVRVKKISMGEAATLPAGTLEYEIVAPQQWEGWGTASIAVIARQGDKVVRNLTARVEVEALAEVAVAARQLDIGTVVTPADIVVRKMDLSAVKGRYLGSIREVAGKKMRSTLRANLPFRPDQLEKIPLIKAGQLVTIIAETDGMRVTITGKARSAGAEGDSIMVQNTSSLKEFPAQVVDATTVRVAF